MEYFRYLKVLFALFILSLFINRISSGQCNSQPPENNVCYSEKNETTTVRELQLCACPTTKAPEQPVTSSTTSEVSTPTTLNGRKKRALPDWCMCYVYVNKTEVICKPECCPGFVYDDNANCIAEVVATTTEKPVLYQAPRFTNCPSLSTETIVNVPAHLNYAVFSPYMLNLTAVDYADKELTIFYSHKTFQATVPSMNTHTVVAHSGVDFLGNKAVCEFYVTVKDEHPPQFITCPTNFERETEEVVTWKLPQAADNVALLKDPVQEVGPRRETKNLTPGLHYVVYKVTDLEGNEAACEFTITIIQKTTPEHITTTPVPYKPTTTTEHITTTTPIPYKRPRFLDCPKRVDAYEDADSPGLYRINITLTAEDYLGVELNVTYTNTEFEAIYDPKNYTVVASSKADKAGEIVQCVFSVSIPGKPPPPVSEKQTEPIWPMIVGGILGFFLLVIIVLAIVYLCKHQKHIPDDTYTGLDYPREDSPAYQPHLEHDNDYNVVHTLPNNSVDPTSFDNPAYQRESPPEASGVSLPERSDSHKYVSIVNIGIDFPDKKPDIDTEYDNNPEVSDVDLDYDNAKFKNR